MLVEKRRVGGAELGGEFAEDVLHAPGMKLIFQRADGLVFDEGVFSRHPLRRAHRSAVWCILEGRAAVRVNGPWLDLHAGAIVTTDDARELRLRIDGLAGRYRAAGLIFENDHDVAVGSGLQQGELHPAHRRALTALAAEVSDSASACGPSRAREIVSEARAHLRGAGLSLFDLRPSDLERLASVGVVEAVAYASMNEALRELAAQPMLVDIQARTGISGRQLRRRIALLQARFQLSQWRDFIGGVRLMSACALLTTPRATTERVARAAGYGSPAALCHAFTRAQLPSPGTVRTNALAG